MFLIFRRGVSRLRNQVVLFASSVIVFLTVATAGAAHDFWIIPDIFSFPPDSTIHLSARSGTRFPAGNPVPVTRIAEARVISASSDERVTQFSIEGSALRMHYKPSTAGQYLVAVALTAPPQETRTVPSQLLRFLRAEGGEGEAARLEQESGFGAMDSVVYASRSYASTVVQVGRGGPAAFSKTAGYALEFAPRQNPLDLHVGDTLHVRMASLGIELANISVEATPAADTLVPREQDGPSRTLKLSADSQGIVHVPLASAGLWILRSAYARKRPGAPANTFDVARATYTFSVSVPHTSTSH